MTQAEPWLQLSLDHPALAGHFPGDPIVPGALLLDEALNSIAPQARGWRIANVKFHGLVRPLEPLWLERRVDPSGALRFSVHSRSGLAMSAVLEQMPP